MQNLWRQLIVRSPFVIQKNEKSTESAKYMQSKPHNTFDALDCLQTLLKLIVLFVDISTKLKRVAEIVSQEDVTLVFDK